jgi:hypothetical protein
MRFLSRLSRIAKGPTAWKALPFMIFKSGCSRCFVWVSFETLALNVIEVSKKDL